MSKTIISLIALSVVVVFLIIASFVLFDIVTVEGNQIGVKETWSEGVLEDALLPRTYILFPGFTQKIYKYDISSKVFVMNDLDDQIEFGEGRRYDSYAVQSAEGQDMVVSLNVRWRIDPAKIIIIHKTIRDNIEEKVLRPEIMRVVKDQSTIRDAIVAYSGAGLVKLQSDIFERLADPAGELRTRGVIVENFVIEQIGLDPEYVGEIKARQVAIQRELRAHEETKAALAEAEKVKAVAQAEFEKSVVDAKRDKEVGILSAQKKAEQEVLAAQASAKQVELAAEASKIKIVLAAEANARQVELAAEANKIKTVLAAEAEKEAGELTAQAIRAIGIAEAEVTKLKLSAYDVPGAQVFVQIEVAKQMAGAFQNIRGYLPQDMKINLLSESFLDAIQQTVSPKAKPVPFGN